MKLTSLISVGLLIFSFQLFAQGGRITGQGSSSVVVPVPWGTNFISRNNGSGTNTTLYNVDIKSGTANTTNFVKDIIGQTGNSTNAGMYPLSFDAWPNSCHPTIIDVQQVKPYGSNQWGGFRYWLASSSGKWAYGILGELLFLYASDDMVTWVTPPELTNPIVTVAMLQAVDTQMTMAPDPNLLLLTNGTMLLTFVMQPQGAGALEYFGVLKSVNGVSWTSLSGTPNTITTVHTNSITGLGGPCMVDLGNGKIRWFYQHALNCYTEFSDSDYNPTYDTWTSEIRITDLAQKCWHSDFKLLSDKNSMWLLYAKSAATVPVGNGGLGWATSSNKGTNWTFVSDDCISTNGWTGLTNAAYYKSAMLINQEYPTNITVVLGLQPGHGVDDAIGNSPAWQDSRWWQFAVATNISIPWTNPIVDKHKNWPVFAHIGIANEPTITFPGKISTLNLETFNIDVLESIGVSKPWSPTLGNKAKIWPTNRGWAIGTNAIGAGNNQADFEVHSEAFDPGTGWVMFDLSSGKSSASPGAADNIKRWRMFCGEGYNYAFIGLGGDSTLGRNSYSVHFGGPDVSGPGEGTGLNVGSIHLNADRVDILQGMLWATNIVTTNLTSYSTVTNYGIFYGGTMTNTGGAYFNGNIVLHDDLYAAHVNAATSVILNHPSDGYILFANGSKNSYIEYMNGNLHLQNRDGGIYFETNSSYTGYALQIPQGVGALITPCRIITTNGFASYSTNYTETISAGSAPAAGYTNLTGINMNVNFQGTGMSVEYYHRSGINGATVCGQPIWTNTSLSYWTGLVGPNCGIRVQAGTGITYQTYAQ